MEENEKVVCINTGFSKLLNKKKGNKKDIKKKY